MLHVLLLLNLSSPGEPRGAAVSEHADLAACRRRGEALQAFADPARKDVHWFCLSLPARIKSDGDPEHP